MPTTYRPYQPEQSLLLPPSLRDWLPEGHLAGHVSDLVDGLDLTAFHARYEGDGRRKSPYEPRMMLKVLLYGYATGVFSSRGLARKLEEDVAFRVLGAGNFPSHRAAGLGDCIDCTMCVQVCPTGIDIRDGLQHQCIACAACVDVCDQVMEHMGYPKGLVRYTTQNAVEGRPTRIVRPRVLVYAGGLAALLAVFAGSLALRVPAELDVIRDRNALYRETGDGLIRNVYTLKIVNMHDAPLRWRIGASGIDGLRVDPEHGDREVAPGEVASVPVRLDAPRDALPSESTPVRFTIEAVGAAEIRASEETRFLGPAPKSWSP